MRVLLFGPYPFFGQPLTGGVMAVVQTVAQGLARRPGLQIGVAAAHVAASRGIEQDGPVTIYRLPVPRYPRLTWFHPLRRLLLETANHFQPDLIHGHGTGYNAAAALDSPFPCLITVHGVVRYEAILSTAQSWKERLAWQYDALFEARVLRRIQHAIAISPYVRRAFSRYPHIAWRDIPNPVDDAYFALAPQPQPGRLLCPARVIPRKGIDALIQAFAAIAADFPHAHLRIAGEMDAAPAYAAHCRQLSIQAGIEPRVSFLGNLARADLLAEYRHAQAVVLAARQETAPVAVAEALAAGCPVIATAVGGLPDMVEHGQAGLLVPPNDPSALADALRRLLADPSPAWGQAARASAGRFQLDAVLDSTVAVYEQVLATRP